MNALLVYPEFPPTYWSLQYSLRFVGRKCLLPPLGLVTVAAMLPSHWRVGLVDLNIEDLKDAELRRADVVLLSGMQVQRKSMHDVLRRCKRLGVPTIVGGPYATSQPELLDEADYLVLGEIEETISKFCDDFEAGRAQRVTINDTKPDVTICPVPRFDLLRKGVYHHMSLQYSRGCPFSCEFCDIIVMFGRNPRTKSADQVQAELDAIMATGFRGPIFFVDDNFIGNKKAVRTMLPELRRWQERRGWPFTFYTEASLNLAEDSALMSSMSKAGFDAVFIGIETPSTEALIETRKNQNIKSDTDIAVRVHEVLKHGMDVWAGFIIGFDSDGPDIFDRQIEFIERAAIPFAMVGLLHALPGTPLESKLKEAGRLRPMDLTDQFVGRTNFETILPDDVLLKGYARVLETLYQPRHYFNRILNMLRHRTEPVAHPGRYNPRHLVAAVRALTRQGIVASYRRDYWSFLREVYRLNPARLAEAMTHAATGHHFIEYTRTVVLPRLARGLVSLKTDTLDAPIVAAGNEAQ